MHTGLHMQIQGRQTGSAIVHGAPWRAKLGSTAMHLGFRQPTSMNVYSPPQVKAAIVPNAGAERRGLGYVSILMDRSYLPYPICCTQPVRVAVVVVDAKLKTRKVHTDQTSYYAEGGR